MGSFSWAAQRPLKVKDKMRAARNILLHESEVGKLKEK
jgi:hypothetical protein